MDASVFDLFQELPYTFLKVTRGGVSGSTILAQHNAVGVFKERSGMTASANQENRQSNSTLHIHPNEDFVSELNGKLVGHGIRIDGADYTIESMSAGRNFETGELEHYKLTLAASDFSEYGESS